MAVSLHHESFLTLVREHPELVPDLLARLRVTLPAFTTARISDTVLHELAPVEHFADAVVLLAGPDRPLLGVIVEAQLQRDDQKLYTWPQYAMNARARHQCPFLVMVATPSPSVARWAGRPIDVGNGTVFRQHIIGPRSVPKVTDAELAAREPELAVLSAITHAHRNTPTGRRVAIAVITGLAKSLDGNEQMLYMTLVTSALGAALRKELDKMTDIRNLLNAADRRKYDKAQAKGRAEGRAETLLKILTMRDLAITPHQQRQISECTDLAALDRWLGQALTATSVDELLG